MSTPSLNICLSSSTAAVTGDSTNVYPVIYDSVQFDLNSNYNPLTGEITISQNGIYIFNGQMVFEEVDSAHTSCDFSLVLNGISNPLQSGFCSPGAIVDSSGYSIVYLNGSCQLAMGDVITVFARVSGGSKVVEIAGTPAPITYLCMSLEQGL